MTVLTIYNTEKETVMILQGHSGYSKSGTDIVCAAISTLTYTWINQLEKFKEEDVVEEFEYKEGDGLVEIRFQGDFEKIKYAFDTIITGYLMIEQNFFSYFRVIRGEM